MTAWVALLLYLQQDCMWESAFLRDDAIVTSGLPESKALCHFCIIPRVYLNGYGTLERTGSDLHHHCFADQKVITFMSLHGTAPSHIACVGLGQQDDQAVIPRISNSEVMNTPTHPPQSLRNTQYTNL